MKTSNRTALVTGASAGIGAAFARHLAAELTAQFYRESLEYPGFLTKQQLQRSI